MLLTAVSHDLRGPLARAKAAVSGLRSCHARLTAADHEELLATAGEALDRLAHLTESLLDVSRLQAAAPPVFPRPSDLGEIVATSLDGLGLVVSRGLAEAMGGTVDPEETPGGGLTMLNCMPAAPGRRAGVAKGARQMRAA